MTWFQSLVHWFNTSYCDNCEKRVPKVVPSIYTKAGLTGYACPPCHDKLERACDERIEAYELEKAVAIERRRALARSIVEAENEKGFR